MGSLDFLPRDECWTPPPELGVRTPRRLRWTGAAIASVVLAGFYFCFVSAIALATYGRARRADLLQREGIETEAVVTSAWTASKTPMVAYRFSANGQTVLGEHDIPSRRKQALGTGSHTPVRYVGSDPGINRPDVSSDPSVPYWVPLLFFAVWIVLVPAIALPIRKERRLLKYGEAAAGVITNNPQGRIPKYGYVLKYEFQLPDGSTVNGKTQRDRRRHNGETVCVIYDPTRPRTNDMYPTRLWRIRQ